MIHFKQGKRPRKRFLPVRELTISQLIKKAQQGSEAARKELEKRMKVLESIASERPVYDKAASAFYRVRRKAKQALP